MILKGNRKLSNYKKVIYVFLIIILILLAVILKKIDVSQKAYNPQIYNNVYEEYYALLQQMENENIISDKEIQDYIDNRMKNIKQTSRGRW